jgi:hypothetical protein
MAFEYIFDYNQSFYIKITNILKQLNIDVEETLSSDHMYGLQEFVTGNVVIFELNKKTGNVYISYYNPCNNNFWNEKITSLIFQELQKIVRINHLNNTKKNILRESIERCLVS